MHNQKGVSSSGEIFVRKQMTALKVNICSIADTQGTVVNVGSRNNSADKFDHGPTADFRI